MPVTRHSAADIVRQSLVTLGLGSLPSANTVWPINIDSELDLPDNTITIRQTQGRVLRRTQYGVVTEVPGLQVRVRNEVSQRAYDKLKELADACDVLLDQTVVLDGVSYSLGSIRRTSTLISLGKLVSSSSAAPGVTITSSRYAWVFNCVVFVRNT